MKTSKVQLVGIAAASIGIAAWIVRASLDREPKFGEAAVPSRAMLADVAPPESSRVESPQEVAPKPPRRRTVRDYLAEYYGADWEWLREKLERDRKALLDRPLEEDVPIASWAESEADARARVLLTPAQCEAYAKSELELDPTRYASWERVRQVFPDVPENLGQRDLEALQEVVKPYEERVLALGLQRSAILADIQAMKWESGSFRKAPYALPDVPGESGRKLVFSTAGGSKSGWAVQLNIYEDELPPEYFQYWEEIRREKSKCLKAAMDYIATL
jgi:hypothetical protein